MPWKRCRFRREDPGEGRDPDRARARDGRYPFEFRLRAVQLYLEEGFPVSLVAEEMGCSSYSIREWARAYGEHGEAALKPKPGRRGSRRCLLSASGVTV